ncbi:hypothetical protein XELAEV_18034879mg [Xenopus laevis]|uniref:Uncharacterized protein n=1 Tax=Xenopus laevis TaxID=8355 RepID=A0A974CEP5_XENLA|nr:hypothetical protein XELAEV_18034879mg [Xenopus laevis]
MESIYGLTIKKALLDDRILDNGSNIYTSSYMEKRKNDCRCQKTMNLLYIATFKKKIECCLLSKESRLAECTVTNSLIFLEDSSD